jgi:hypothetical protein
MTTIRSGQTTDYTNQGTEFKVEIWETDGAAEIGTGYTPDFKKWNGYYRKIPELRAVINKMVSWTFGRKFKTDKANLSKLKKIRGFGKDTARGVLKNQWKVALICGDSYAHEIKDAQGRMTNLKPLNPGMIASITNKDGILIGYQDMRKNGRFYDIDEIYHLSYERTADEIHGIPFVESLEELVISRNEAISDMRILYHRNIKPIQFFEVETDDQTKLNDVENTINSAYNKSENVVIAAGVIKEIKKSSTAQYSTLDSLPYIKFLVRQFVTACGMPEIVMGWGGDTTEASAKIIIIAFEQEIWDMKIYNEEQIETQLGIILEIEMAPSIMDQLQKDQKKDVGQVKELNTNPNKDG